MSLITWWWQKVSVGMGDVPIEWHGWEFECCVVLGRHLWFLWMVSVSTCMVALTPWVAPWQGVDRGHCFVDRHWLHHHDNDKFHQQHILEVYSIIMLYFKSFLLKKMERKVHCCEWREVCVHPLEPPAKHEVFSSFLSFHFCIKWQKNYTVFPVLYKPSLWTPLSHKWYYCMVPDWCMRHECGLWKTQQHGAFLYHAVYINCTFVYSIYRMVFFFTQIKGTLYCKTDFLLLTFTEWLKLLCNFS
jgi:hypothetical protein